MASASIKESTVQWAKEVRGKHSMRGEDEFAREQPKMEQSRRSEKVYRQVKAAKSHSTRSRALVGHTLTQISISSPSNLKACVEGHHLAQTASASRRERRTREVEAFEQGSQVALLCNVDSEEAEALEEAAALVGAPANSWSMAAPGLGAAGAAGSPSGGSAEQQLEALRHEPRSPEECESKFKLYECYSQVVEEMRNNLLSVHSESASAVPEAIAHLMNRSIKSIDSEEAMGIPDDSARWFVYDMMRQAMCNNARMDSILQDFEEKMRRLARDDQPECPICLNGFEESGARRAQTLGCCHKVCQECWGHWCVVTENRPFCPLCRHCDFRERIHTVVSREAVEQ